MRASPPRLNAFAARSLHSLSHDLKTPLTSIVGAATSLRDYGERFDAKSRVEMIATIEEEAARMARFVGNLLDMTRLEAGSVNSSAIQPMCRMLSVPRCIGPESLLTDFKVSLDVAPNLPLLGTG